MAVPLDNLVVVPLGNLVPVPLGKLVAVPLVELAAVPLDKLVPVLVALEVAVDLVVGRDWPVAPAEARIDSSARLGAAV